VFGLGAVPPRLRRWCMNAFYGALTVVLLPYALARIFVDHKTRSRWWAYARDLPARYSRRRPRPGTKPCLWVHGVSVGEVKSVAQLVEAVTRAYPDLELIVSVSTDTGRRVALARYPGHRVEFYPPDLSWIVDDALDALAPDLIVLAESGFWPTFICAAANRGIPVVVVNGKMSERSAGRYAWVRALVRPILANLREVCVQLEGYGARFQSLGVDPARIHVTGNMKLDNIPIQTEDPRHEGLARLLGDGGDLPLLVAGSTHPGEERALARIRRRLTAKGLPFRLLLVPRHPARADNAEAQVRKEGLSVVRRSRLDGSSTPPPDTVVLLDTVGELEAAYTLADLVFVGGTLVRHGGQNMMEPASLGCPVVLGPSIENFRGEVDLLLKADGLVLERDADGVERTIERWLRNPEEAEALGQRARDAIVASKGATERTFEVLRPLLDEVMARHRV
jgi:3-deoxy-D-manno-octulosonic-acid transferase